MKSTERAALKATKVKLNDRGMVLFLKMIGSVEAASGAADSLAFSVR